VKLDGTGQGPYRAGMRRSSITLPALAAALLALSACAGSAAGKQPWPAPRPAEPKAFLWEITKPGAAGQPLYLTGSIHAGQPGQFTFPPAFEGVIARAEALVVEVDPAAAASPGMQQAMMAQGLYAPPDRLSAHLDPKTLALLPEGLARVGLKPEAVERLRPWMLAITLSVLELQKAGYDPAGGIDALLVERFRGRELVPLETPEAQLAMLAGLPDRVQSLMVREAIEGSGTAAVALAQIAAAWQGGNPEGLASALFERADDPELAPMYEAVFHARNRAMSERLAPLVGGPKLHLAVVGAGHVVGPKGLLALLEAKGFRVRQVERE